MKKFAVMSRLFCIYAISDSYVTCNLWQLLSENLGQSLEKFKHCNNGKFKNIYDLEFALYNVYKTL